MSRLFYSFMVASGLERSGDLTPAESRTLNPIDGVAPDPDIFFPNVIPVS